MPIFRAGLIAALLAACACAMEDTAPVAGDGGIAEPDFLDAQADAPNDSEKPANAKDASSEIAKQDPKEAVETPPPLPPAPTAEEIARRRERALPYKSLAEKLFDFPVTGTSQTRYRLRAGESEGHQSDQDIQHFVSMDFGDKSRHLATGHFDARVAADVDGRRTGLKADIFSNLVDTYDDPINARLYSAYVDFNKLAGIDFLRAGRQFNYDATETLQFDGLRLDTDSFFGNREVRFSFYGGLPVHTFEASAEGDALAGFAAEGRPWKLARMRLDYIHVEDDHEDIKGNSGDPVVATLHPPRGTQRNDLVSFSLWQTLRNPDLRLQGRFTILDGNARDALARLIYARADDQFQIAATYRGWFERQGRLSNEFDTFFQTLSGQEPYHHGNLVISKGWREHFWLESGVMARRLMHGSDEKQFNREFDRYYATFEIRDLPLKGLAFSLSGSRWEGLGHAPDTTEFGGEIGYSYKREFRTLAGTDYALYKYDLFINTERDRVRTYYVKQRWRPKPWAALDVSFEHERSRSDTFNTLTVTFRLDF